MDAEFWHRRWRKNEIAFHEGRPNGLLVQHFGAELGGRGGRVFLPMCGKTRDIGWLLSEGYRVAGAELSRAAVEQLFAELDVVPEVDVLGSLTRFSANGLDIYVGDIFDLTAPLLGPVDLIYDRAALVALPQEMRARYAAHMMQIAQAAPQFLVTFEYDQSLMDGPPFSVTEAEVRRCYGAQYVLTGIECVEIAGGLKGKCPATENAWLLQRELPK